MSTKADLAKIVLKKLKALDPEETPEAADSQDVQDAYDRFYQELLNDNLVMWAATANIPTWAENPVSDILAWRLRSDFESPLQNAQEMQLNHESGWHSLRRQLAPDYVPSSESAYF